MVGRDGASPLIRVLASVLAVVVWAGTVPPGHRSGSMGPQDGRPAGRSLEVAPLAGAQGAHAAADAHGGYDLYGPLR